MWDEYHVGIRTPEDIRTWEEVLELNDEREGQFVWGDFSRSDAEQALKDGTITVYSSHPIKNGTFVSTSYIQAREYAGGKTNSKVYSKTIPLNEVAWINGDEGQYAKVSEVKHSIKLTQESQRILDETPELKNALQDLQNELSLAKGFVPEGKVIHKYASQLKKDNPCNVRVAEIESDLREIYTVLSSMSGSEGWTNGEAIPSVIYYRNGLK